jgi:hypothetical protein
LGGYRSFSDNPQRGRLSGPAPGSAYNQSRMGRRADDYGDPVPAMGQPQHQLPPELSNLADKFGRPYIPRR